MPCTLGVQPSTRGRRGSSGQPGAARQAGVVGSAQGGAEGADRLGDGRLVEERAEQAEIEVR